MSTVTERDGGADDLLRPAPDLERSWLGQALAVRRAHRIVVLDPVASVVFEAIGEGVARTDLVNDLAEGFGVPRPEVEAGLDVLLGQLDEQALLQEDALPADPLPPSGPKILLDPPRLCGPSIDDAAWAPTRTVRIGDLAMGVRATAGFADDLIGVLLADHVVDEHAPTSFSVVVSQDRTRLHRLMWGTCTMVRTPDPERLVEALLRHLQAGVPEPAGWIRLRAPGLLHESGAALLVDDTARRQLAQVSRSLNDAGFVPFDTAVVDLDPTGQVVRVPSGRDLGGPVDLTGAAQRRSDPTAAAGEHRLRALVTFGPEPAVLGTLEAMYVLQRHVERSRHAALSTLVDVAGTIRVVAGPGGGRSDLLATISRAAG